MTRSNFHLVLGIAIGCTSLLATFASCTDSYRGDLATSAGGGGTTSSSMVSGSGGEGGVTIEAGPPCNNTCSNDLKNVVDCYGNIVTPCTVDQGCADAKCIDDPCKAAEESKSSYGCDYWALKTALRPQADGACFAAFVANTWGKPVHLKVDRGGAVLAPETFTYIPSGQGQAVTYTPYNAAKGLDVGEVAIMFLARKKMGGSVVDCPKPAALSTEAGVVGTGRGSAFHITSDYPVVAYQIDPYGGGQAAVTSATLLLPTSAWDTNYIAINAYKSAEPDFAGGNPSLNILAYQDGTDVQILPKVNILAGPSVVPAVANTSVTYKLNKGEYLQITQPQELTGSPILSTKPIGVFGASTCMTVPIGKNDCDSAQQQLAPVKALGSEYAAVRYRSRSTVEETPPWRIVGAVDGTTLTWTPKAPAGAPSKIGLGEVAEFTSAGPFVVASQDAEHPFYLGGYMTGGEDFMGEGDPDWVNIIPPSQYLNRYVLFTDPTYPETSLVVVRTPSKTDKTKFADVTLACGGILTGWEKFGDYEYARVELVTKDFMGVNGCTNGRQEMSSDLPFGVTVWGWGNTQQTKLVSYAYPAGAGFQPINKVVVPPIPQ
jgi:IgGFc binding protein